jgi:phage gp16-like protein
MKEKAMASQLVGRMAEIRVSKLVATMGIKKVASTDYTRVD